MKKTPPLAEIVFSSSDPAESKRISRQVKAGRLRKIAPRIYGASDEPPETLIRRNWLEIVAHYFPGATLSHRTAFRGLSLQGVQEAFVTTTRNRRIVLPGLTLRAIEGPGPDALDMALPMGLFLASVPRQLLENLQPSRARKTLAKSVGVVEVESFLERQLRIKGEAAVNALRDDARVVSKRLGLTREFTQLDQLIGALLRTRPAATLHTRAGLGRARGEPYDPDRLTRFELLVDALKRNPVEFRGESAQGWENSAFFDAYFSNYIEGTEFEVDQAAAVIFEGRIMQDRPKDSHDILGTYQVTSNRAAMQTTPESVEDLLQLIKRRHLALFAQRPEIRAGEFKTEINRAGDTVFVHPELVRGTLLRGFDLYQGLAPGFERAAYLMFLISEVHPMVDGNGRLSRLFMNAELVSSGQSRILIPTVYREDYLLNLRRLSRDDEPLPFISMMDRAHRFTSRIDFSDYAQAKAQLAACNAFKESYEGVLRMPED
ncbi:Fic/DOC family protein [Thiogranum longum]|uniref:Fic/DOC family protein n=1 Tax=Thiogranum longum TaxID=1537524 RepID=A0A4V6NDC2_9GAMM|nr:Fic family protein [Thiogranum longum]TCK18986.1 Fic/DOC family protein [Thiogranum longum]